MKGSDQAEGAGVVDEMRWRSSRFDAVAVGGREAARVKFNWGEEVRRDGVGCDGSDELRGRWVAEEVRSGLWW